MREKVNPKHFVKTTCAGVCFLFVVSELRSKVNELELRLQGQEKEMKGHAHRSQELQLQLEKTKAELMEKDKVLNKNRDELGRMTAQYDQAAAKVLGFP